MNTPTKIILTITGVGLAAYALFKLRNTMQTDPNLPRGYRNNNPLNIRISSSNWLGKVTPNTDGSFEQFTSMAYGYRAAFVLIRNYINLYGLRTVSDIISRWAPNNENNTSGYISRVCKTTGFSPDTVISPNSYDQMSKLVYAMAIVENGTNPMPKWSEIQNGWQLI